MRRLFLYGLGALTVVFAGVQFVPTPELTAAPKPGAANVWQDRSVPPEVGAILRRSCSDCHSLETRWPWYAHVAPVSWLIESDVKNARSHMNLSNWPVHPDIEKAGIGDMVLNRMMPPKRYLLLHPDAKLSDADRNTILHWIQNDQTKLVYPVLAR